MLCAPVGLWHRLAIVAMLTRMAMAFEGVAESDSEYDAAVGYDFDYERRFAEHDRQR